MTRDLATEPIRPLLDSDALEELRDRLERRRGPPTDTEGWERGVPLPWLAQLLADWQGFDIARFQARLDELTHLRANVEGQSVHLVHVPGRARIRCRCCSRTGGRARSASICRYLPRLPIPTLTAVIRLTRSRSSCRLCRDSASPRRPRPAG